MRTLVLGIGNLLLGDEGVGVHAVRALLDQGCPPGVEMLEVGTAVIDALPSIEKADRVIVIDAMQAGKDPGAVYRLPLKECFRSPRIASMHGFDIFRVLELTGREKPPVILVFGVEPLHLSWSMELSSQVKDSLPMLLEAVEKEIRHTH